MTEPTAAGHPDLPGLPIVAVDVDGVLNPEDPHEAARLGYRPHQYNGPGPHGQHLSGAVWLHPDHGVWLYELAMRAQLVWCTRWNQFAATWIAPRLGLPDTWTHIPIDDAGVRFGHQTKLGPLFRYAGNRPVAVLDEEFGGKDPDVADERTARGASTLLRPVDPFSGLRRPDVDAVLMWLDPR
jgi:hypothetical protein